MSKKEKFFYFWLGYATCRAWRWLEPGLADAFEKAWKGQQEKSEEVPHKFVMREVQVDGTVSDYCCGKPYSDPIHLKHPGDNKVHIR